MTLTETKTNKQTNKQTKNNNKCIEIYQAQPADKRDFVNRLRWISFLFFWGVFLDI